MKEKVINGILHWSNDFGEWIPFTLESLTIAFVAAKGMYEEDNKKLKKALKQLERINDLIKTTDQQ